jgi:Zinc knuckle
MENNLLQGKDKFPKSVADASKILARWKNRYGNKVSRLTKANDGIAFATINDDKKKGNKKKEVTCYKCNKVGHYSNKCDEEETIKTSNKKGTNLLVHNA